MRALTARQAFNCETAREARCQCRCGGALHGARRGGLATGFSFEDGALLDLRVAVDVGFFEQLPAEDPHHLPTRAERRAAARAAKWARTHAEVEQLRLRWAVAS